jgi:hypothetical protein
MHTHTRTHGALLGGQCDCLLSSHHYFARPQAVPSLFRANGREEGYDSAGLGWAAAAGPQICGCTACVIL